MVLAYTVYYNMHYSLPMIDRFEDISRNTYLKRNIVTKFTELYFVSVSRCVRTAPILAVIRIFACSRIPLGTLSHLVAATLNTFLLLSNVFVLFYFLFTITFKEGCILLVLSYRVYTILNTKLN